MNWAFNLNQMKVLLATHNPGKIKEYQKLLAERGIEVETLKTLGIGDKFEETQETFKANAGDKARFYFNLAKLPILAEDGGFEIDYLNGEPGVKSRRWLGYETTDGEIVKHLAKAIKGIPENKRRARFTATLCLAKSETDLHFATNSIEGYLTEIFNDNYDKGFPYRAFFIEQNFKKHLMDLSPEEYSRINHRQKNIEEIIKYL